MGRGFTDWKLFWAIVFVLFLSVAHADDDDDDETAFPPNILIFLVDDLGWNDVSYHGSQQIPTPNIDALARGGVVLTRHYAQSVCSPSRAALLTGKYPIHVGLSNLVIQPPMPYGLPLTETIMPQHFQSLGYTAHIVGKWHMGFFKKEYCPTMRGFETFFGMYLGGEDFFDHTREFETKYGSFYGLDFHDDVGEFLNPTWEYFGNYSSDLFADRTSEIIKNHKKSSGPLLLYVPFQAVHDPTQGKTEDIKYFGNIWGEGRRTYATQVKSVDDAIGKVFDALKKAGMDKNTLILFASDNGGATYSYASNYPLRSSKGYQFEGGVRVPAFIWGPGLPEQTEYSNYMHISDWLPTLYRAAGGDPSDLGSIDGVDQWDALRGLAVDEVPRDEMLLNIDTFFGQSAVIQGKYKLYKMVKPFPYNMFPTPKDGWYNYIGPREDTDTVRIYERDGWKLPVVDCTMPENPRECDMTTATAEAPISCLFDIESDPCEYDNLAEDKPDIVELLSAKLDEYAATMAPPQNRPADPNANPALRGGIWMPWRD